jgi:Bacterial transglutaminase-like N-terminal region
LTILEVRHPTIYRYREPVGFGDHRLMLRPRDSHDLRLIQTDLNISPPASVCWHHDVFGDSNRLLQRTWIGIADRKQSSTGDVCHGTTEVPDRVGGKELSVQLFR